MRAVIISGGTISDYSFIKSHIKNDDTIICADKGYEYAKKMRLNIEIAVGDFDSIDKIPSDVKIIKYPSQKDQTDTEIAIDYAIEKGFSDFLIIAGIGTRMDHTLANILLLKRFLNANKYAEILDEHNKIMITNSKLILNENIDTTVSLIPITDCFGVTTCNLLYPLTDASLHMGTAIGISNVIQKENAFVSVKNGTLLVIVAND